jgi:hypothetical protein
MPIGTVSLDPNTPYLVYEFSFNNKVFYVGHTWGTVRHGGRWGHVKNLVKHEIAGTLKPDKANDLNRKSNRVIATLIYNNLPEHTVAVTWRGLGKALAAAEERKQILRRVSEGCLLANVDDNPRQASVREILQHLGVKTEAPMPAQLTRSGGPP